MKESSPIFFLSALPLSGLCALSQSQVGFIQLLPLIKHHEEAQHREVVMAVMMMMVMVMAVMMMVMVMVVVMIMMTGSPKPENAYIWDCIEVMLDTRENWG